eukprot:403363079
MPQMTEIYLDKEDDVLDFCKKVVFRPDSKRKKKQQSQTNNSQTLAPLLSARNNSSIPKHENNNNQRGGHIVLSTKAKSGQFFKDKYMNLQDDQVDLQNHINRQQQLEGNNQDHPGVIQADDDYFDKLRAKNTPNYNTSQYYSKDDGDQQQNYIVGGDEDEVNDEESKQKLKRYSIIVDSNILMYSKQREEDDYQSIDSNNISRSSSIASKSSNLRNEVNEYVRKSVSIVSNTNRKRSDSVRSSSSSSQQNTPSNQNKKVFASQNRLNEGDSNRNNLDESRLTLELKKSQSTFQRGDNNNSKPHKPESLVFTIKMNEAKPVNRRYREFLELRQALARAFPGCFVPKLIQLEIQSDLPQIIFEKRKPQVQCKMIESFCEKIQLCQQLVDSDVFKAFMNPKVKSINLEEVLGKLSRISQSQILSKYKEYFLHLSGLEVNQSIHDKIEKFGLFIRQQNKVMQKFKNLTERSISNQNMLNQRLSRLFISMSELEEVLACEDPNDGAMFRSQQKSCERFNDLNIEMHMSLLHNLDDFVRDELSDCESFNEAMREIKRLSLQRTEIKTKLDRSLEAISLLDRKIQHNRYRIAKNELNMLDREFRDLDMLYNIIIINMAYVEIDKYKLDRQIKYVKALKDFAQINILSKNEVRIKNICMQ